MKGRSADIEAEIGKSDNEAEKHRLLVENHGTTGARELSRKVRSNYAGFLPAGNRGEKVTAVYLAPTQVALTRSHY